MGGQSRCPGETGTQRRESHVNIVGVISRCDPANGGDVCTNKNLLHGQRAHFGVIILNESPTGLNLIKSLC